MKIKFKCESCKKNQKRVTKENLCASCSLKKNGVWAREFGKPATNQRK